MKQRLSLIFSAIKITVPVLVLVLALQAWSVNWLSVTAAWFTSSLTAVSNKIETGNWTPAVPEQYGWNLPTTGSATDAVPTDLACGSVTNGGDPDHPRVSFVWSEVTGTFVKYQREVTYPDSHLGYFYADQHYTDFESFGADAGINGIWKNRTRAFIDLNDNGSLDSGEPASAWSDYCQLTLDTTGPDLAYTSFPYGITIVDQEYELDVTGTIDDLTAVDYQVKVYQESGDSPDVYDGNDVFVEESALKNSIANGSNVLLAEFQVGKYAAGDYWLVLEAEDEVGNQSELAEKLVVTQNLDSSITVTNSPTKLIQQKIKNFSFEQQATAWQGIDPRQILDVTAEAAHEGEAVFRLAGEKSLQQKIENSGLGIRSISFWYKLQTVQAEEAPVFVVKVNDKLKYQAFYNEDQTNDWQMAVIYLVEEAAADLELEIELRQKQAEVWVDDFRTDAIVVNPEAVFAVNTDYPEQTKAVYYRYFFNGYEILGQGEPGLEFKLAQTPDDGLVEFWSEDIAGHKEESKQIQVLVDNQRPQKVSDFKVFVENEDQLSLSFTAPSDDSFTYVRDYEIKYATEPIFTHNWSEADHLQVVSSNGEEGLQPPRAQGLLEEMTVTIPDYDPEQTYYFALKSVDVAGNESYLSNVAQTQTQAKVQKELVVESEIKINEIMYVPESDQDQEWVELYHTGEKPVDLTGWWIEDGAGRKLILTEDYVLQPGEWLVVYKQGEDMFDDAGDQVKLFNVQGQLVDQYQVQGDIKPGYSEARLVDGGADWQQTVATAGASNQDLHEEVELELSKQSDQILQLEIINASAWDKAEYVITYQHLYDEQILTEALQGKLDLTGQAEIQVSDLYLGTCSALDEDEEKVCTPHQGLAKEFIVEVNLFNNQTNEEQTVESHFDLEGLE